MQRMEAAVPSHNSASHWEKADLVSLHSTHFSVPEAEIQAAKER